MSILYAAAPVLTAVLLILGLRQSAVRAGFAGLSMAFLVVWLVPGFHLAAQPLSAALAYGGLTTLVVSYVLLGGVVLYQVMQTGGALGRIAGTLARAIPDPGRRVLVLVLGLSVFFESVTGFGIGIIVTAPLFMALGFSPLRAAFLSLLGQCAVTWGALGIGTILGSELTGVPVERMGVLAAPMTLPLMLICGGIALHLSGERRALLRRGTELLLYVVILAVALALGTRWVGIELAGALGGLAVTAAGLVMGWRPGRTGDAGTEDKALWPALLPLTMLLATLLATRLIPPVRQWLEAIAVLRIPELGFAMPVIYHPGFWLLASALSSAPVLGVTGERLGIALAAAGRQWAIATLAVAGFLCFSQVMFAAGMTARLAEAVAGAAGSAYLLVLPLIGGLGGFLTASNAGSNAMFAQFQTAVGAQLGLPETVIATAQNAAGANATLASPGRIVLAASVTQTLGQERALMRPALLVAGAGLACLSVMLWLWLP